MTVQEQFIQTHIPYAVKATKGMGVFPEISLAQAILETGYGRDLLSQQYHNYFGIKSNGAKSKYWKGGAVNLNTREEFTPGTQQIIVDGFRVYDKKWHSFADHVRFLKDNANYRITGVFRAKNYETQAHAIAQAGYATGSGYADTLIHIIKTQRISEKIQQYKQIQTIQKGSVVILIISLLLLAYKYRTNILDRLKK